MALDLDTARILEPVSADLPCGEDLDEAGDFDFLNAVARVEGQLPASFLRRNEAGELEVFDRASIDFARESALLLDLLDRTRDLRLLTLLARLAMLDRDPPGFGRVATVIADLLEARWEAVHPRGDDGDFDLRAAVLQSLEDNPTVILPLQHVTLTRSRRHGAISFRTLMVADGEVPPPGAEPGPDRAAIEKAFAESDPDALEPLRGAFATIAAAIDRIAALTLARGGRRGSVGLERLAGLVRRTRELLGAVAAPPSGPSAPEAGPAEPAEAGSVGPAPPARALPVGAFASTAQAIAALAAAAAYLRAQEPSSPAEVLVRQAQALVGKSFVDVMRILMPDRASEAAIVIGAGRGLRLTFDQLLAVPDDGDPEGPQDDPSGGDGSEPGGGSAAAALPAARAATRAEAVALLSAVAGHFRRAEPASPIPLLLEKATSLADRDFLAILKDVLSESRSD